jgi:hypothetical protein
VETAAAEAMERAGPEGTRHMLQTLTLLTSMLERGAARRAQRTASAG